jgi:hypothetical protein
MKIMNPSAAVVLVQSCPAAWSVIVTDRFTSLLFSIFRMNIRTHRDLIELIHVKVLL